MQWVGLRSVIVVFPDPTHLLVYAWGNSSELKGFRDYHAYGQGYGFEYSVLQTWFYSIII